MYTKLTLADPDHIDPQILDRQALTNSADQEQSDQGSHCLPLFLYNKTSIFELFLNFKVITANILGVKKFRTLLNV